MVAGEVLVTKALAALVADERACLLACFQLGDLGLGRILVLIISYLSRLELIQGLVLSLLEELQRALH